MNTFQVRQVAEDGRVIAEETVSANNYDGALRQLKSVTADAQRIEVYHSDGKKAGVATVSYWRQKGGR